jgi:Zn-dependent protease
VSSPAIPAISCSGCGTELAGSLLRCPACRRLVHADRLSALSIEAEQHEQAGDAAQAVIAWRAALDLLPSGAAQAETIQQRIASLTERSGGMGPSTAEKRPDFLRRFGPWLGAGLLLAWKLKFVLVFLLTKAKFLLLGLTKASTLFSMVAAAGVYWTLWGWKFALGIVGSIYIHEMGHVAALRRYGIKASAPMFIPGFGAIVRLHQRPATPAEDARTGLAGPVWGLGAALAAAAIYFATKSPIWAAIAHFGAWVNLFNLLPVWQLDGGRAFNALTRNQRWLAVAALGGIWFASGEPLLVLLAIAAAARAFGAGAAEPDPGALSTYVALVLVLALLSRLPVPGVT